MIIGVSGTEMLFFSVLLVFLATMKERLANTSIDKVLCPTRVQLHVPSPCGLEKWFFLLGRGNSGNAAGECLFCIRRVGFVFGNGAPPGEKTAVNDEDKPQMYQEKEQREGVVIRTRTYSCALPFFLSFFVVS